MKMKMSVQVAMSHVSKHNLYQPFGYKHTDSRSYIAAAAAAAKLAHFSPTVKESWTYCP